MEVMKEEIVVNDILDNKYHFFSEEAKELS